MDVNIFLRKVSAKLQMGNLLLDAVRVHGGLMHTMYRLDTNTGTYTVKLLNPKVMMRPEAMNNFNEADRLENILEKFDIPIIPSLIFDGRKMQELDGQYYYVYEWYDGKIRKGREITKLHCQKISKVLSRIHLITVKKEKYQRNQMNIDWDYYIQLAKKQSTLVYDLLRINRELICKSQNNGNRAIEKVPAVVTICHNDMDSKNVLWLCDEFKIIDLECLGYSNPYLELFELALCWSGYEECKIDFELFGAFIESYFGGNPKPEIDWSAIYDSNNGRLEWLEYNVKRALLLECNSLEEQELAIGQVEETIKYVIYYDKVKDKILQVLRKTLYI